MKEDRTIWGIPIEEVERQCKTVSIQCDSNTPINASYGALDPSIEGGKKILSDPKLCEFFYKLYTGDDSNV